MTKIETSGHDQRVDQAIKILQSGKARQRQDSETDQLKDVRALAKAAGCLDALRLIPGSVPPEVWVSVDDAKEFAKRSSFNNKVGIRAFNAACSSTRRLPEDQRHFGYRSGLAEEIELYGLARFLAIRGAHIQGVGRIGRMFLREWAERLIADSGPR